MNVYRAALPWVMVIGLMAAGTGARESRGHVSWKACSRQQAGWYSGLEAVRIGDNVLLYDCFFRSVGLAGAVNVNALVGPFGPVGLFGLDGRFWRVSPEASSGRRFAPYRGHKVDITHCKSKA